jgi:hypothetical protein
MPTLSIFQLLIQLVASLYIKRPLLAIAQTTEFSHMADVLIDSENIRPDDFIGNENIRACGLETSEIPWRSRLSKDALDLGGIPVRIRSAAGWFLT